MIREDALLALKKAEDMRNRLVEETNFAKARRDATFLFWQENNKATNMKEVNYYV